MKRFLFVIFVAGVLDACGLGQGVLWFSNGNTYTRIGSLIGPVAGPSILAQLLVGQTVDSLAPVGETEVHHQGAIRGDIIAIPGILPHDVAQVQMVAWDGSLWGSSLATVPAGQLGKTDVVPLKLGNPLIGVPAIPDFKQGAVVPIPEPSTLALAALGAAALALICGRRGPPAGRPA